MYQSAFVLLQMVENSTSSLDIMDHKDNSWTYLLHETFLVEVLFLHINIQYVYCIVIVVV